MGEKLRNSGIDIIGDIPWGTHFYQFYQTKEDLMDILIPYFKNGLENNEFCMWVISQVLDVDEAKKALRRAFPYFDAYLETGQIEIIPYKDWYAEEDGTDSKKALKRWIKKADQALDNGYDGLRLVQDISGLKNDWKNLIDYEEELDSAIENRRITARCTYSSGKFDTNEIIGVALNHLFVLVKKEGKWEKIENPRLKRVEERAIQAARELETKSKEANENLEKLLEERTVQLEKTCKLLKESEKCLSQAQKMAHIGNWKWNVITGELSWSEEVYRIFGRDPREFGATYDAFLSYVHPDDREYLVNSIKKGFNGEPQNIDYRIILPDGEERAVHTQAEIIFDEKNIPVRAEGIVQDITERKRTETALCESEEQYRAFFENSIDAVLLTSPDGTINAANPAACKIFGMTEEEITRVGRNGIVDVSDPRLKPGLEERARTGKFRGELNYRRKDGTILPGELSSAFFKDKNGFVKTVMIIRDITERKQTEEALRKSEEHYRMLFTNMTEAFFLGEIVCDKDGRPYDYRFLKINPAFELHAGVKGEQVLGKSHLEVFHKADPTVIEKYGQVALSGNPTHFEFFTHLTSRYLDIYVFSPEQGKFAAIFRDITERKKIEEKTRQRAEEMEAVMEVAPVAIWIGHDLLSQKITGNKMANEFYGANTGENVSANVTPVRRVFREGRELTADELPMQEAALKNIDVRNEEIDVLLPSGKWRAILGSASPLHDAEGRVRGSVGAFVDITERKKVEAKLKKTLDNLENLVKERTAELEKAYNSLKESEQSLAEAQKMAHIGNWDWDLVTNELYVSDEMCRIFGLNPQEFDASYDAFLDYVHPADRDYINTAYKDVLNGKELVGIDYRIVSADGKECVVHGQGEVILNEENTPVRIKGTLQDITERKKAEEKIRYLANIVESSNDAIVTLSLDGIITSWNKGAEQVYGYSAEEILGKNVSILEPENLREETKQLIEKIKQKEKIRHYRTLWLKKDGTIINVSIALSPVFDATGKLVAISGIVRDVTERIKAEEALRESEARLRQFYESDMIGVYYFNLDGSITDANDKLLEMVGYTREDLQAGRVNWDKMTPPEYRQLDERAIAELKTIGVKEPQEKEYIRKDGSRVPVIVGVSTFDQVHNEGIAFVLDITEKKKAEEALAKIEDARKKEIHHRIKNNLQVISSLLDLQAEKFKGRKNTENSEILSAFRESQDRVISISLIHEGLHEGKGTNELNFSPYLEKLVENLFQTYSLGNVDLNLDMDLEENIFFDIDIAVPLGLIVNEIVSNSLKYAFSGRDKGTIQIKLRRDENGESTSKIPGRKEDYKSKTTNFVLTVSDNGVGLPENFNVEDSDTLGLQLIFILVDQLDGKLELKRDAGTEFTIRFAVAEKE